MSFKKKDEDSNAKEFLYLENESVMNKWNQDELTIRSGKKQGRIQELLGPRQQELRVFVLCPHQYHFFTLHCDCFFLFFVTTILWFRGHNLSSHVSFMRETHDKTSGLSKELCITEEGRHLINIFCGEAVSIIQKWFLPQRSYSLVEKEL